MPDTPITRAEFNQFIKAQNGSLERIERRLEAIEKKIDDQRDREEDCQKEMDAKIVEASKGKVPWPITVLVTALSTAAVGLLVVLVTHALK